MMQESLFPDIRVITVDDSSLIADRLRLLLGELDGVRWSGNALNIPEALSLTANERPHVIILDIHLSRDQSGNGIDLLNLIKKLYPVVKIIMLTNLSAQRYRDICTIKGADFFLDKSNDFDKIPEILTTLTEESSILAAEQWWNKTF